VVIRVNNLKTLAVTTCVVSSIISVGSVIGVVVKVDIISKGFLMVLAMLATSVCHASWVSLKDFRAKTTNEFFSKLVEGASLNMLGFLHDGSKMFFQALLKGFAGGISGHVEKILVGDN
jgi:hypothetical protein